MNDWKNPQDIMRLKITGQFNGNICQYCSHWLTAMAPWCEKHARRSVAPGMPPEPLMNVCYDFKLRKQ